MILQNEDGGFCDVFEGMGIEVGASEGVRRGYVFGWWRGGGGVLTGAVTICNADEEGGVMFCKLGLEGRITV